MEKDHNHNRIAETAKAIETLRGDKSTIPVVLSGRIVNGKVVIDQHVLDSIAKAHPGANGSFIAVNAPFDPSSATVN